MFSSISSSLWHIRESQSLPSPESEALNIRRQFKKFLVLKALVAGLGISEPKFSLFCKYLYLFLPIECQTYSVDIVWPERNESETNSMMLVLWYLFYLFNIYFIYILYLLYLFSKKNRIVFVNSQISPQY